MSGIVIIEHDVLMDALLREYLTEAGYEVCDLTEPDQASALQPDLVIIDVSMPRSTGAERVRSARAQHPGTPLIAISGQFCARVAACGATTHALGAERLIAKPFDREELIGAVRAVIGPPA